MNALEITNEEESVMNNIRRLIPKIVGIRLEAQKVATWLNKQNAELTTASEEMEEAINALYLAENTMGNTHQYLLVSQATIKHGLPTEIHL